MSDQYNWWPETLDDHKKSILELTESVFNSKTHLHHQIILTISLRKEAIFIISLYGQNK